jgi:hypothetical protein
MIESRHAEFATQHLPSPAPLLAAALPAVFFSVLGVVWYATNNWLAGFVFLFTLFVAIGSWCEDRELRRIAQATSPARTTEKILMNAHYAEIHRRTPELLRGAFIIAAVIPAILAYA